MRPFVARQRDQLRVEVERFGGDAQLCLAFKQPFGDLGRAALMHIQANVGVALDESLDHWRQGVARLGVGGGQRQQAVRFGSKVGADVCEIERFPEDGVRLVENQAAGRGDAGERLPLRTKTVTPSSSSSRRICFVIPGWEVYNASAASETFSPRRSTSTRYFSC